MIKFTAFDDEGRITSFGVCQDVDFLYQGKNVIVGNPPGGDFYVGSDGKFVPFGAQPSPHHDFDHKTWTWVVSADGEQRITRLRAALLLESDWTDTASAPARLGGELYLRWQAYRQALRDITDQPQYPFNIVWPTPPQ